MHGQVWTSVSGPLHAVWRHEWRQPIVKRQHVWRAWLHSLVAVYRSRDCFKMRSLSSCTIIASVLYFIRHVANRTREIIAHKCSLSLISTSTLSQ